MSSLTLDVNLSEHVIIFIDENEDCPSLDGDIALRIREAFTANCAAGLPHLGTIELETALPTLFALRRKVMFNPGSRRKTLSGTWWDGFLFIWPRIVVTRNILSPSFSAKSRKYAAF